MTRCFRIQVLGCGYTVFVRFNAVKGLGFNGVLKWVLIRVYEGLGLGWFRV